MNCNYVYANGAVHSISQTHDLVLCHRGRGRITGKEVSQQQNGKDNSKKGIKSTSKNNAALVVEELASCHLTPPSSMKAEEKKDNTNYSNRMKLALK